MSNRRLTPFSKLLLVAIVTGTLFFGFKQLQDSGALENIINPTYEFDTSDNCTEKMIDGCIWTRCGNTMTKKDYSCVERSN